MADEAVTPKKPTGAGDVRGLNLRVLENGFVGSADYEPAKTKKGDMCCNWVPNKEYVLASEEAVLRFVSDVLGFKRKSSGNNAKDLTDIIESRQAARAR